MIEGQDNIEKEIAIDPKKRLTGLVSDDVPVNKKVAILVESDKPIVCERPMYFGYHGWCPGGHDTLGYGI